MSFLFRVQMGFQGRNWENGKGTERGPGSSQARFLQEESLPVISGNCDNSAGAWCTLTPWSTQLSLLSAPTLPCRGTQLAWFGVSMSDV